MPFSERKYDIISIFPAGTSGPAFMKEEHYMVYDKISNLEKYLGISPNLDTAIRFLLSQDLNEQPLGHTDIEGRQVFVNVMEAEAMPAETKNFEIHKEYMDIQIDLRGIEVIETGDASSMEIMDYDAAADFGSVKCPTAASCVMGPGNFILCMTSEPHKPGILHSDEYARLKKCVFKVHV